MSDALEVHAHADLPLGVSTERFLADYWQQRPLLVRRAIADFVAPIDGDDLAGVAGEPEALARLVEYTKRGDRWQVREGPFSAADFARLPARDWTLLVQDCDKWFDSVHAVLERFAFIPAWRVDDVMVSFAAPGGSVGAHVDHYDVFLLQGAGQRRWQISTDPHAAKEMRVDAPLKLLREFRPTHDWVLEPGDLLYLPPGVPHFGLALDACLTFSIGMRAPSWAELAWEYVDACVESLPDEERLVDASVAPPKLRHELGLADIERARTGIARALAMPPDAFADWLGGFFSRYRNPLQAPTGSGKTPRAGQFDRALAAGHALVRNPWSRLVLLPGARGAVAWINGERYPLSRKLALRLDADLPIDAAWVGRLSAADRATLATLHARGHLRRA